MHVCVFAVCVRDRVIVCLGVCVSEWETELMHACVCCVRACVACVRTCVRACLHESLSYQLFKLIRSQVQLLKFHQEGQRPGQEQEISHPVMCAETMLPKHFTQNSSA